MTVDSGRARLAAAGAGRQLVAAVGAGLYWSAWALAKVLLLVLTLVGGVFWSAGWLARRAIWPALRWCGSAVALGWADGRHGEGSEPAQGQRGRA